MSSNKNRSIQKVFQLKPRIAEEKAAQKKRVMGPAEICSASKQRKYKMEQLTMVHS